MISSLFFTNSVHLISAWYRHQRSEIKWIVQPYLITNLMITNNHLLDRQLILGLARNEQLAFV